MDKKAIKILLVEDNLGDVVLLKYLIPQEYSQIFPLMHVRQLSEALERLQQESFDIILVDLSLPDSEGINTVQRIYAQQSKLPIVVLTGLNDEEMGLAAIQNGAQDYLIKGQIGRDLFLRAIRYAMERKRMELAKDDLLSNISHELRTPLCIIKERLSQTLDGMLGEITEKQHKAFSAVFSNVEHLIHVLNNLLDMAKIESMKFDFHSQKVNMVELLRAVKSLYETQAKKKGLQIKEIYASECIEIYADKEKIVQVLMNLMNNAIKFTEQGLITIAADELKEGGIRCSITDTGKGIAKKDLPKLFAKFMRVGREDGRCEKGTGLGLFICKGIIELHKGRIWLESELDHGTKVNFTLPKTPPECA